MLAQLSGASIGYYQRCSAINNSVTPAASGPLRLERQEEAKVWPTGVPEMRLIFIFFLAVLGLVQKLLNRG